MIWIVIVTESRTRKNVSCILKNVITVRPAESGRENPEQQRRNRCRINLLIAISFFFCSLTQHSGTTVTRINYDSQINVGEKDDRGYQLR